MTQQRFVFGEGKISGYISIFLGLLSFLAVFCFQFPEWLTSPEFRAVYTGKSMVILLTAVIVASFFFAVLSFLLSKRKHWALIGMLICTITIVMGGFSVQGRAVDKTAWYLGLDWMLLDLLLMAVIFVPIEMVFPKNLKQRRFHEEWRTDLVYFVISHLFIQFFGIITQQPAKAFFGWIGLGGLHHWVQQLPFVIELIFAFVVTDLFQYWAHRFFSPASLPLAFSLRTSFYQKHGLAGGLAYPFCRHLCHPVNGIYSFVCIWFFADNVQYLYRLYGYPRRADTRQYPRSRGGGGAGLRRREHRLGQCGVDAGGSDGCAADARKIHDLFEPARRHDLGNRRGRGGAVDGGGRGIAPLISRNCGRRSCPIA